MPEVGYYCQIRRCTWDGACWRRDDDGQPLDEIKFQGFVRLIRPVVENVLNGKFQAKNPKKPSK